MLLTICYKNNENPFKAQFKSNVLLGKSVSINTLVQNSYNCSKVVKGVNPIMQL